MVINRTCRIEGCPCPTKSRNYCDAHYRMWSKYGTPTPEKVCQSCGDSFIYYRKKGGCSIKYCPECKAMLVRVSTAACNHGLQPMDYVKMMNEQNGHCYFCPATVLHIDHDHRHCPGEFGCKDCVRGLLCRPCNWMLGHWENHVGSIQIPAFEEYIDRRHVFRGRKRIMRAA